MAYRVKVTLLLAEKKQEQKLTCAGAPVTSSPDRHRLSFHVAVGVGLCGGGNFPKYGWVIRGGTLCGGMGRADQSPEVSEKLWEINTIHPSFSAGWEDSHREGWYGNVNTEFPGNSEFHAVLITRPVWTRRISF